RVKECDEMCNGDNKTDCDYYKIILESDMMPGGQYGQYMNPVSGQINLTYPLSVYNANNILPKTDASWRNPRYITPNGIQNMYVENSGDRSKIILFPTIETASGYDPEPLNVNDVQLDPTTNEFFIYPEQLKN